VGGSGCRVGRSTPSCGSRPRLPAALRPASRADITSTVVGSSSMHRRALALLPLVSRSSWPTETQRFTGHGGRVFVEIVPAEAEQFVRRMPVNAASDSAGKWQCRAAQRKPPAFVGRPGLLFDLGGSTAPGARGDECDVAGVQSSASGVGERTADHEVDLVGGLGRECVAAVGGGRASLSYSASWWCTALRMLVETVARDRSRIVLRSSAWCLTLSLRSRRPWARWLAGACAEPPASPGRR
jgi:hypothetical protein